MTIIEIEESNMFLPFITLFMGCFQKAVSAAHPEKKTEDDWKLNVEGEVCRDSMYNGRTGYLLNARDHAITSPT
ncbi:MAG: hypothetical protein AABZ06_01585, partial [Bdellovibrionota bacterium]